MYKKYDIIETFSTVVGRDLTQIRLSASWLKSEFQYFVSHHSGPFQLSDNKRGAHYLLFTATNYYYYYYIRLMAFFQDNLGKLAP